MTDDQHSVLEAMVRLGADWRDLPLCLCGHAWGDHVYEARFERRLDRGECLRSSPTSSSLLYHSYKVCECHAYRPDLGGGD